MSGSIGFKYFPASTWRPSGAYVEFDPSQANTATQNQRALIVGQILAAGTAAANVPVLAYSQAQVNTLCGANSMLALQYSMYRQQDPYGEVWLGPLADNSGGSQATGTITITGTASANGTLALYFMGISVPVTVTSGDAPTAIAANIATQFGLAQGIAATVSPSAGVVTLTASHKGIAAGDIDIRLNYRGVVNNEITPAGVSIAIVTTAGGTLNPVLTTLLANTGTQTFDFIVFPYSDATSLTAITAFLNDQTGRWSSIQQLYGHAFMAYRGTVGARGTFGNTQNTQHISCLGFYDSPTPAWLVCADFCGAHTIRIRVNPAQGVAEQSLVMLAPPVASQDSPSSRNTLLYDGISTFYVDPAGTCHIDRSVTTYQTNSAGQPDNSYLNTNLMFQAMYAARYIITQVTSQFIAPGKILVSNGTPIPMGAPAVTPDMIFQAVVGIYNYLSSIFIVQNPKTFAQNGYATTGTKGQVLLFLPVDFSDQVVQIAALIQFRQST